ncbi:HAMP domain-containing sensor histidine kinase [Paenibacillus qinlingensis]|uniref:histidine kinase n=1 Tax=Paenibacillus qinlingensis TaxID=1837343 RepID=A0ABU1NTV8_9BACL|nr:HAMP domain-containing sensor histidine kinase [Paenibacillus qinlingensis]MDR6550921.1 signal transduction histidine kinase [Paenibacillus qinlingensis]
MKNNLYKRIVTKLIIMLTISAVSTLMFIFCIYTTLRILLYNGDRTAWLYFNIIDEKIGIQSCYFLLGFLFFIGITVVLSLKPMQYFMRILESVEEIEAGHFDHRIATKSDDELSQLAMGINRIVDRLQRSQQDELKAEQTKNELITNVSHDLRTPLTSILGYLRLISEDRYKDEVELRYYTDIAYTKSRRLERMVNDLFDYTQMSYGQSRLNRSKINITDLISQLAADFSFQLREANMEIRLSYQKEIAMILADGDKLMRALENLISNAIRYSKYGRFIDVSVEQATEHLILHIMNDGMPIPSADLPHIFERFYRAEKSRSEHNGGSGLGLAIVKSIVDAHEGTITVSSSEQHTVFEIKLPLYI